MMLFISVYKSIQCSSLTSLCSRTVSLAVYTMCIPKYNYTLEEPFLFMYTCIYLFCTCVCEPRQCKNVGAEVVHNSA